MFSPPSILCSCKAGRCTICMRCTRCGCAHDGISVESKLRRRRGGGHTKPVNPSHNCDEGHDSERGSETRRSLMDDEAFNIESSLMDDEAFNIESSTTVQCTQQISMVRSRLDGRPRRNASRRQVPVQMNSPAALVVAKYQDLLRHFGVETHIIDSIAKNIGKMEIRCDSGMWEPSCDTISTKTKATVFSIYTHIFSAVAKSICGEEAGIASLQAFTRKRHKEENRGYFSPMRVNELMTPLVTGFIASKRGSVERRTLRAILCGLFSKSELIQMSDDFSEFQIGKDSYYSGREDLLKLLRDGELIKNKWSRERFVNSVVDDAIQFILSFENVAYISWGTKRIILNDEIHIVPAILRKKPITAIYDTYLLRTNCGIDATEASSVSKRTFYRLCGVLTHGETTLRTAVDYVSGILVNDNLHTLKRIVVDLIPEEKDKLMQSLDILRNWLKYGSFAPVLRVEGDHSSVDECPRHQCGFGLSPRNNSPNAKKPVCCSPCLGMNTLLNHIIEKVKMNENADARTISVVHDCFEKFELFMGHRLRVVNQQRAIANHLKEMDAAARRGERLDEAFVTIDFKMKAEPMYYREKTLEHYGKRGMSWHGSMVQFWAEGTELASHKEDITQQKIYYNHISGSDNRQDKEAVVCVIEAILIDIKRDLPQIKRITLQSDNASSYQNSFVAILLPILGIANGLKISRFLHTDTQDGKSLLDAQFARAGRKVKCFVKQGNDCATPHALVAALISDGGLPNTMAEIVEYDRELLSRLLHHVKPMEKAFSKLTGRLNDILYTYDDSPSLQKTQECESAFDLRSCPKVYVRAFTYSNIGCGKLLVLDPKEQRCNLFVNAEEQDCEEDSINQETFCGEGHSDDDCGASDGESVGVWDDIDEGELDEAEASGSGDEEDGCADDELDILTTELVLPHRTIGRVTGVHLFTEAQIRRRLKVWKGSHEAIAELPTSRRRPRKEEKDVVSYAKKSLLGMKNAGSLAVSEISNLPLQMRAMIEKYPGDIPQPELDQGWGQRPPKGKMYGAKYISMYMDEIAAMFRKGADNKSDKMGPARMVETLMQNHPRSYDIPGENEIRTAISRLFADQRKLGAPSRGQIAQPPLKKQFRMEKIYSEYLNELLIKTPELLPKAALGLFREAFPDVDIGIYSDDRVKNKVASLRRQRKNKSNNVD